MKLLIIATCTYAIFVLHAAFARDLAISGIAPHLILAGLVVISVRVGAAQGMLLAAVWGLLADCLTEGRLGPHVVCFAIVVGILHRNRNQRRSSDSWKLAALSIPMVWGVLLAVQFWHSLAEGRTRDFTAVAIHAAGSAVYTGLVVAGAAYALRHVAPASADRTDPSSPSVSNKWRMLTE